MKIKQMMLTGVAAMLFLGALGGGGAMAASCPEGSVRGSASSLAECNVEDDQSLMPTVKVIINVLIGIVGVIAVVMIIIGGISYVTSQGDATKTKRALQTILFSVIGLVIALLAFAIVNFVLSSVFG